MYNQEDKDYEEYLHLYVNKRGCEGDQIPPTLFHYTNLDVLALILKNKTLRLSRLDVLDDMEEEQCRSISEINVYTYVSCWTNDAEESIPLWDRYTIIGKDRQTGIRIEMPSLPFAQRDVPKFFQGNYSNDTGKWTMEENIDMFNMGKYIKFDPINLQQTLYKICYTDNPYCLKPEVSWKFDNGINNIDPYIQGIFKRTVWSYQKEYRYVIHLIGGKDFSPNKYYDLDLTD